LASGELLDVSAEVVAMAHCDGQNIGGAHDYGVAHQARTKLCWPSFFVLGIVQVEKCKQRAISIDYPRSGGAQVEIRWWGAIVGHGRSSRSWKAWNVGDALTTSGQPLFGFSCRLTRAGES
jgi:hypothetical protein